MRLRVVIYSALIRVGRSRQAATGVVGGAFFRQRRIHDTISMGGCQQRKASERAVL